MKALTGGAPYALGVPTRRGFKVRCIRFGKLAASYERRDGEEIRSVEFAAVAGKPSRPVADA